MITSHLLTSLMSFPLNIFSNVTMRTPDRRARSASAGRRQLRSQQNNQSAAPPLRPVDSLEVLWERDRVARGRTPPNQPLNAEEPQRAPVTPPPVGARPTPPTTPERQIRRRPALQVQRNRQNIVRRRVAAAPAAGRPNPVAPPRRFVRETQRIETCNTAVEYEDSEEHTLQKLDLTLLDRSEKFSSLTTTPITEELPNLESEEHRMMALREADRKKVVSDAVALQEDPNAAQEDLKRVLEKLESHLSICLQERQRLEEGLSSLEERTRRLGENLKKIDSAQLIIASVVSDGLL
ncbi:unnamed protein product [Caenorhabditis auriculariae]|uniref:Uncharacterized protein n=1 Tax=Caenorhabditis auriculariae TaxID=2777116 RepID=A0A8S1HTF4_9PELO|nr:unnamed protein product [Caenorhabditis auriculariae]